jgi:hypothetical protein
LLKEVEKSQGGRPSKTSAATDTGLGRKEAATDAGMSKRQAVTSIRVANIPQETFSDMVESDAPSTGHRTPDTVRRPPDSSRKAV